MPPPVVTGLSPKEGPPGTRVTIRGEFLGNSPTDLKGLTICGCDCLLSAEWKSKNKIIARSGPAKGRGDIIVSTKSGGLGTSTVQFRAYHEKIGPMKESAVWVEEAAPPSSLSWGRRPMSPVSYAPPDPLGLSTEGDDSKVAEDDLNELFPDGSGNLSGENFSPGWYLLEHHSLTSFEDLKAGALFLERKVDGQKEGQLSFLKANTGSVMDQLDRLILLKDLFESDYRANGKEPLITLEAAIEDAIALANTLFSEILARREKADRTRGALALLARHRFLFQLPATIDRNIKKREYDLVINDYTRVKNLFGWTEVKFFKKILGEVEKRILELRHHLHSRVQIMPICVQEQRKLLRLLMSLEWSEDSAWAALNSRRDYLLLLMDKIKLHYKNLEQAEEEKLSGKSHRIDKSLAGTSWSASRKALCRTASDALHTEAPALWKLGRWYFNNELGGAPSSLNRHEEFKAMILSVMSAYSSLIIGALVSDKGSSLCADVSAWLHESVTPVRQAYSTLIRHDLPSEALDIIEKVIFELRQHALVTLLKQSVERVKAFKSKEQWNIEYDAQYGGLTALPRLLEHEVCDTIARVATSAGVGGTRETRDLDGGGRLHSQYAQRAMLAFVACLQDLAFTHSDQEAGMSPLSVALGNASGWSTAQAPEPRGSRQASWQRRLLITASNAKYTRERSVSKIVEYFEQHSYPKPLLAANSAKSALSTLETSIADTYLEQKGDPLVGTIEPSMYMGRYRWDTDTMPQDARPYVYEIISNLIAVHAEVNSVCARGGSVYVRAICETVCEELSRLASCGGAGADWPRARAVQARLDLQLLHAAIHHLLTTKAQSYLNEALENIPPLEDASDIKLIKDVVENFKSRMDLQLVSLQDNLEKLSMNTAIENL